jgi:hypothetical protein
MRSLHGNEGEWQGWLKYELTIGGDATILWFLPDHGAFVFPGDGRGNERIATAEQLESYFCPSITTNNQADLFRILTGDGPCSFEGTREELYDVLGIAIATRKG